MTLNEAIRKGCRMREPIHGEWIAEDGRCCAVGSILVGGGVTQGPITKTHVEEFLTEEFPEMMRPHSIRCQKTAPCHFGMTFYGTSPDGSFHMRAPLYCVMSHLFELHNWSREALAEWADPHPELHIPMPRLEETPAVHA